VESKGFGGLLNVENGRITHTNSRVLVTRRIYRYYVRTVP